MAIGPELVRQVNNVPYDLRISEQNISLVLRDIVQKIARYERPGGDPNSDHFRPPILPVEVLHDFASNRRGITAMRIRVRFFVDWERVHGWEGIENSWSPDIEGRWFSAAELGI
jgi:hypothetical protein